MAAILSELQCFCIDKLVGIFVATDAYIHMYELQINN